MNDPVPRNGMAAPEVLMATGTARPEEKCLVNGSSSRVLYVDDDPQQRLLIERILGARFQLVLGASGPEGLKRLETEAPCTVVMSDFEMPAMDGAAFLSRVRQMAPDAIRMLVTGRTDMEAAVTAVNDGQIFRFLTKPCSVEGLLRAMEAGVEQHRLITAERVLLEQTLRGSIKALTDVLSLANPMAFGRATRIKDYAAELAKAAGVDAVWQIEVSAMLSQIGCITLPPATIEKLYHGQPLTQDEQLAADCLPAVADALLANIPRLEDIRACLVNQDKRFDGSAQPTNGLREEAIPIGARILKIVLDFDVLEARGNAAPVSLDTMRGRAGWYDPRLLEEFAALRGGGVERYEVREIVLPSVVQGMTFAEDVRTEAGVLVVSRGYEVTEALVERIRNFPVKGTVRVTVRAARHTR